MQMSSRWRSLIVNPSCHGNRRLNITAGVERQRILTRRILHSPTLKKKILLIDASSRSISLAPLINNTIVDTLECPNTVLPSYWLQNTRQVRGSLLMFFAYKKMLGRTETRTRERIYCQTMRTVRDISRDDRARIATCSLRTLTERQTDRLKANYSIDNIGNTHSVVLIGPTCPVWKLCISNRAFWYAIGPTCVLSLFFLWFPFCRGEAGLLPWSIRCIGVCIVMIGLVTFEYRYHMESVAWTFPLRTKWVSLGSFCQLFLFGFLQRPRD